MVKHFPTEAAARAAIAAAVAAGIASSGYAAVRFGGSTTYTAHVTRGGTSWALRA